MSPVIHKIRQELDALRSLHFEVEDTYSRTKLAAERARRLIEQSKQLIAQNSGRVGTDWKRLNDLIRRRQ